MIMDELVSKLLYVPFNDDYKVTDHIKQALTEDVFFEKCFVKPDFDEIIDSLISNTVPSSSDEVYDFERNIEIEDMIKKLEKRKEKIGSLDTWLKTGQSDLYCIRGDAGTGKTTLLHYLKHKYSKSISWHIIDIQKATEEIPILHRRIYITQFHSLYYKSISAIMNSVVRLIFPKDSMGKLLSVESEKNIRGMVNNYNKIFDGVYPRDEINNFFESIIFEDEASKKSSQKFCKNSANSMANWFNEILNASLDEKIKFTITLELLIYCTICLTNSNHQMIAFDNFERFIGTDEIYNNQLTEFVSTLRRIQKSIADSNEHLQGVYQIMIFMRNTSVRMFTSQQVTEFFAHEIDLSDWFDVSSILKKKIEWYNNNNFDIEESTTILDIFNDMGACGDTLRGLHFKISMLFNYNKRIVIEFLTRVLFSKANSSYIETYKDFWGKRSNAKSSLYKFAARSIIYRLTLNALREDCFFANIVAQTDRDSDDSCTDSNSLGFARKILTILYEYDINRNHNADSRYMSFEELVNRLFAGQNKSLELLLNQANDNKLETIAQVLFYMNYYNIRKENWLQLIDLQYNSGDEQKVVISDYSELKKYIKYYPNSINIRITNAGKAYLYFVVYYFEFFSCKSLHNQTHNILFQDKDMPPLLCTIPTVNEIETGNIDNYTCVKIIKVVQHEALSCISILNNSANPVPFRFKVSDTPIHHKQRIINSHRGFIDNFIEFVRLYHSSNYEQGSESFRTNFDALIKKLQELRNDYNLEY